MIALSLAFSVGITRRLRKGGVGAGKRGETADAGGTEGILAKDVIRDSSQVRILQPRIV
jgi:hypothetical protein